MAKSLIDEKAGYIIDCNLQQYIGKPRQSIWEKYANNYHQYENVSARQL